MALADFVGLFEVQHEAFMHRFESTIRFATPLVSSVKPQRLNLYSFCRPLTFSPGERELSASSGKVSTGTRSALFLIRSATVLRSRTLRNASTASAKTHCSPHWGWIRHYPQLAVSKLSSMIRTTCPTLMLSARPVFKVGCILAHFPILSDHFKFPDHLTMSRLAAFHIIVLGAVP
jgi:hypothetical protein